MLLASKARMTRSINNEKEMSFLMTTKPILVYDQMAFEVGLATSIVARKAAGVNHPGR